MAAHLRRQLSVSGDWSRHPRAAAASGKFASAERLAADARVALATPPASAHPAGTVRAPVRTHAGRAPEAMSEDLGL